MSDEPLFKPKDFLGIKWQISFFAFSLVLSIGLYIGINELNSQAARDLSNMRAIFLKARSSVELIEEEEATIIRYIDEYKQMEAEGMVEPEDRLQFLEDMALIREDLNLFPINLSIEEQFSSQLSYPQDIGAPGGPINLESSTVKLSVPLLHEEDFTRLLAALDNSPGLYQITKCNLTLRNTSAKSFVTLQQHMSADCEFIWHTYDVDPPVANNNTGSLGGGYL